MRMFATINRLFDREAIILMYHRIARPETDLWELAISPENFETQLKILKRTNLVVPISEIAKSLKEKKATRKRVAITFDDGYMDNFYTAKPLLEYYSIP